MTTRSGLFISLLFLLFGFNTRAQNNSLFEKDYTHAIQNLISGQTEVVIPGGRVDLVTDEVAYEVEWANNWKEAIGQSLWYGLNTNKKPGIILIIENQKEYKYFIQLNSALEYAGLSDSIQVLAYPYDFEGLIWATSSLPKITRPIVSKGIRNAGLRQIRILITTATTRAYNRESLQLQSLTAEYEKAFQDITSGKVREADSFQGLQNQILQPYQAELDRDISKIDGVNLQFGEPFLGAWEGKPEPSLNMVVCLSDEADTRSLSNLLYDMAERTAQDAFILEEMNGITDRIPLTITTDDGYLHYPQIQIHFDENLDVLEKANVARILLNRGFNEFSIGSDYFFISIVDFEESEVDKIRNFNKVKKRMNQVIADLKEQVTIGISGRPTVVNRKSLYISSKNASAKKQHTRTYKRRDIFDGKFEGRSIQLNKPQNHIR